MTPHGKDPPMTKYKNRLRNSVHDALDELAKAHEEAGNLVDALQCRLLRDEKLPSALEPLAVLDKAPRCAPKHPPDVPPETVIDRIRKNYHLVDAEENPNG